MDGLIKGSNTTIFSTEYLKFIVETIKLFEIPQTPQSPLHGRDDNVETIKVEPDNNYKHLDLSLIRLAGIMQICMKNECIPCSTSKYFSFFSLSSFIFR